MNEPVEAEGGRHPEQEIGLPAVERPFEPGAQVRFLRGELLVVLGPVLGEHVVLAQCREGRVVLSVVSLE